MNTRIHRHFIIIALCFTMLLAVIATVSQTAHARSEPCGTGSRPIPCPSATNDPRQPTATETVERMNEGHPADPYAIYCVKGQLQIYKINEKSRGDFFVQASIASLIAARDGGSMIAIGNKFSFGRKGDQVTLTGPKQFRSDFSWGACLSRAGIKNTITAQPDFNRDSVADIVTAGGRGEAPFIRVASGVTGGTLLAFNAFDLSYKGGVSVAVGDLNGDGIPDIVAVPATSMVVHVKAFDGRNGALLASFFAFGPTVMDSAKASIADVNGDGRKDIVVEANGGGHVYKKVFDGQTLALLVSTMN